MEKKEEYGVPWLWKRVPFVTWVNKAKGRELQILRQMVGLTEIVGDL